MKTFTIITFVFAILVAIVVGVKSFEVHANKEAIFTPTDEIGTRKVLRIKYCTLKQGDETQEFEQFVTEEFNPLMNEFFPGMPGMIMKGDRGPDVGQYIVVWESSLHVRNFYMPEPGKFSAAVSAIGESYGDLSPQVQKRFKELADRTGFTDYVEIVKK
jgi:hypothetical protein